MTTSIEIVEKASLDIITANAVERAGVIEMYLDIGEDGEGGAYNLDEDALYFGIVGQGLRTVKSSSEAEALTLTKLIDKQCSSEWSYFQIRDIMIESVSNNYIESLDGIITYLGEPLNQEERDIKKKQFLKTMKRLGA